MSSLTTACRLTALRAAADAERWADQSESATTMTTKGGIVGRGGGLVIWEARL